MRGLLGTAASRLQNRQNPGKLLPADVAEIGMRHDYPSLANRLVMVSTYHILEIVNRFLEELLRLLTKAVDARVG